MRVEFRDDRDRRKGQKCKRPFVLMTEGEYHELSSDHAGLCLACGELTECGCEPDARRYECGVCGERRVYGLEECVMMGRVEIDNANEGELSSGVG